MTLIVSYRFRINLNDQTKNRINILIEFGVIYDIALTRLHLEEHGYDVNLGLFELSLLQRLYKQLQVSTLQQQLPILFL